MTAVLDSPALLAAGTWPLRREVLGRALLVALLVAAPLPLGGAAEPARTWLVVAAAAVALIGGSAACGRDTARWLPQSTVLWLLVLAVPALQLLPLPGAADPAFGGLAPRHGSWVPAHTLARFGELAAAVALFVASARLCDRASACRRLIAILLGSSVLFVCYGLSAMAGLLPLLDGAQTRTVMVGTFVNRNHAANLLVMAALLGAGVVMAGAAAARRGPVLLAASAVVVAVVGVVATASRGALLALVAGAIVLPTLLMARVWTPRRLGAAVAVAAIAVLWLLPADVVARFARVGGELRSDGTRPDIWRGALALWETAPWFGTGLGTFGDLSPATQSADVPGRVEHAHCDPLEWLVETGLVGAALALAAVGVFLVAHWRRCRDMHDRERARLGAGALAALVAFGVHAMVEFPLQMPANLMWAAGIGGIAAGLLRPRQLTAAPPAVNAIVFGLALTALGIAGSRLHAPGAGDGLAAIARGQSLLDRDAAGAAAAAREALARNPFSPRAHQLLGRSLLALGDHVGARAAFVQALAWTNPADRPQHQLAVAIDCLHGGALEAASWWLHDLLPALSVERQREALAALHTALPAAEVLLPLLATQPPSVRSALADVLLRRGDFVGREAVLAQLGEQTALATVAEGLRLIRVQAEPVAAADGLTVPVQLEFDGAAAAGGSPMVLRCDGPTAAVHRPFRLDGAVYRHTVRLDPTFPPGRYELGLDFRRDAPAYPLATVEVPASPLALAPGVDQEATALYWATGEPDRRTRPPHGVPLRRGDVAWRAVVLADDAAELVVETETSTRLQLTFGGVGLPVAGRGPDRTHRVALPAVRNGVLTVRAADGDEPVLRRFFVIRRGA